MSRFWITVFGISVFSAAASTATAQVLSARVTGGEVQGVVVNGIASFKGVKRHPRLTTPRHPIWTTLRKHKRPTPKLKIG